jgi:hypothetical protein
MHEFGVYRPFGCSVSVPCWKHGDGVRVCSWAGAYKLVPAGHQGRAMYVLSSQPHSCCPLTAMFMNCTHSINVLPLRA